VDTDIDLRSDSIPTLAPHLDRLANTNILIIDNIINELPSSYAKRYGEILIVFVDRSQ
jgi:hypothetical protein